MYGIGACDECLPKIPCLSLLNWQQYKIAYEVNCNCWTQGMQPEGYIELYYERYLPF